MPNVRKRILSLAPSARLALGAQEISAHGPGTILADVQSMLQLIGKEGIPTKSKGGNLPMDALAAFNDRLSAPIELHLTRPLLRDYPNLAGVFVLIRVLDLVRLERGRLALHLPSLSFWNGLNPVEQYFALLEAWLFYAEDDYLGGSSWHTFEQFSSNTLFLLEQVTCRAWKTFDDSCHTHFCYGISTWNTQLQARFGLIELQARPVAGRETSTRGWLLKKAKRTPWGEAVIWAIFDLLKRAADNDDEYFQFSRPREGDFGFLKPAFTPHFPAWQRVYWAEPLQCPAGQFIFKATLDSNNHAPAWRRLAVPAEDSLAELAVGVLAAFKFTALHHFYELQFHHPFGNTCVYYHSNNDLGPDAGDISIGDTGLRAGGVIHLKFKSGDGWRFTLRLEKIDSSEEDAEGLLS